MKTNTSSFRMQNRWLLSTVCLALALSVKANAESVVAKQSNDNFTLMERPIPALSPLNREAVANFTVRTEKGFKPQYNPHFRICGDYSLVPDFKNGQVTPDTRKMLANHFVPEIRGDEAQPEPYGVVLTLYDDIYQVHVPLVYSGQNEKSRTATIGLSVNYPTPFVSGSRDCVTSGNWLSVQQTVDIQSLADVTPVFQPLDWQKQILSADGKRFTATVSVLGAVPENTVVWVDETDREKPVESVMTRRSEILSEAREVDGVSLPAEVIGGVYTVELPVPTLLTYTASVKLKKGTVTRGSEVVVNGEDSSPVFQFRNCTHNQCIIQWGGVIPYRNDGDSLGIDFATAWSSRVKEARAPVVFSVQPDSRWQEADMFTLEGGALSESIVVKGNIADYFGPESSLFSSGVMPHRGAFTLNFEPEVQ